MTSWVAVDESRAFEGPARDELIPQELPYGTKASAFGLRGAVMPAAPMEAEMALGAALDYEDDEDWPSSAIMPRAAYATLEEEPTHPVAGNVAGPALAPQQQPMPELRKQRVAKPAPELARGRSVWPLRLAIVLVLMLLALLLWWLV